jgi:TolB-like protein
MVSLKKGSLIVSLVLGLGMAAFKTAHAADRPMDLDRGLNSLAQQLTSSLPSQAPISVAIADFWDLNGRITGLGRLVAEEMPSQLFDRIGRIRIIERDLLGKVVEELCFNESDLFEQALAGRLGKFIGADAVLVGTITDLGATVRINARIISTENRDILAAANVSIAKDERITLLLALSLKPIPLSDKCQGKADVPRDAPKEEIVPRQSLSEEQVFENDLIKVTVKSLVRSRSSLFLEILYENLTEHPVILLSSGWGRAYATDHRGTYLVNDGGERWSFKEDLTVGNHYGGTVLVPRQRLLNRIIFVPEMNNSGSEFTYVGNYRVSWRRNPGEMSRQEDFQVVIRNIKPTGYGVFKDR